MGFMEKLVDHRSSRIAREIMALFGLEIHPQTSIGAGLRLQHRGMGTVIHPDTRIGERVAIYHQVTVGRADAHLPRELSQMGHIEIGDDVIIYPGAKILGGQGVTRIGHGTIIGANAVLTQSTGDWEVWVGIPARKVAMRHRYS